MKKILLISMLVITSIVSAQDVIITNDSRKIDAKIIEVSQTEVKYKEKNNPNGPTFVLSTKDINSIIYANGSVSTYNQPQSAPSSQYNQVQSGSFITRTGNSYFYNGKSMSKDEYLVFAQNNCREAWESYQHGHNLWKNGWILFGTGMGCVILGTSLITVPYSLYYSPILWGIGGGLTIGSIPCLAIGSIKMNNSHEIFNQQCARRITTLEFGIQSSQNGLGLAMKF